MAKFSVGDEITFQKRYGEGTGYPVLKITAVGSSTYTTTVIKLTPYAEQSMGWQLGKTFTMSMSILDTYYEVTNYGGETGIDLSGTQGWLPMSPEKGPPLPQKFGIYWPWYKG